MGVIQRHIGVRLSHISAKPSVPSGVEKFETRLVGFLVECRREPLLAARVQEMKSAGVDLHAGAAGAVDDAELARAQRPRAGGRADRGDRNERERRHDRNSLEHAALPFEFLEPRGDFG